MAEIIKVKELLKKESLSIPNYQRPYKWTGKNISSLLEDIDAAIEKAKQIPNFKYRIGTVILHKNKENLNIVDGQQRIISLYILALQLNKDYFCPFSFTNEISLNNIHENAMLVREWLLNKDKDLIEKAFEQILEAVVITVDNLSEAFQLFDSQNTRGKMLDPHDLLKAYHLRAMREAPNEMRESVEEWENAKPESIHNIFDIYLFPILNWAKRDKTKRFSAKSIDVYKGVSSKSTYTYAKRAEKSSPIYQITEPFVEGKDFFNMVSHYINLLSYVQEEIKNKFPQINSILNDKENTKSTGFTYAKNLFYCAVIHFYDKFCTLENKQCVVKLFTWAMMLRVNLENLGFDSINKYAIGEGNYTNNIPMFYEIDKARNHGDIARLNVKALLSSNETPSTKWSGLYDCIKEINRLGGE